MFYSTYLLGLCESMHTLQVFFIVAKIPYTKPAKSYIEQLSHLKQIGLIVKDDKPALKYLETQFIKT